MWSRPQGSRVTGRLFALLVVLAVVIRTQSPACAGPDEFQFFTLQVQVSDTGGNAVPGALVKAYSQDWPLLYPHDGFSQTGPDGMCRLHLPRGRWRIVAGGGASYTTPNSGQALFLLRDVTVQSDTVCGMQPDRDFALAFRDRASSLTDLEEIYAAPSALVPNCLMPDIGRTTEGVCSIHTNLEESVALFLVRRPTSDREGYFVFLNNVNTGQNCEADATSIPLRHVHFISAPPQGSTGVIEWKLCFPYQDIERHWGHTSFTLSGEADAYLTPDFINYVFYVKFDTPELWTYVFHLQGVDLSTRTPVTLAAGGPLTPGLRVYNYRADSRTQFWLGPSVDAYGNVLQFYTRSSGRPKIPLRIYETGGGRVLYDSALEVVADHLEFDIKQSFPQSSTFALEWDLGPYGGHLLRQGALYDPRYEYTFETVRTEHFDVYAPTGFHAKTSALAARLERAYSIMSGCIGAEPPDNPERSFRIHPVGLWAAWWGQALYTHGFVWWHQRDPASLGWESQALHEVGHRMEWQLFHLEGPKNEVVASMLAQLAIEAIHGEKFARPHRQHEGQRFFDNLENPHNPPRGKNDNLFFVVETYLPKRCGKEITKRFFRTWGQAWAILGPQGYSQDQAYAALYSALAGDNLWWLFDLSGFHGSETRNAKAMALIADLCSSSSGAQQ